MGGLLPNAGNQSGGSADINMLTRRWRPKQTVKVNAVGRVAIVEVQGQLVAENGPDFIEQWRA